VNPRRNDSLAAGSDDRAIFDRGCDPLSQSIWRMGSAGRKAIAGVATARCNDDDCANVGDSSGLCNHETNRCCRLGIYLGENAMRTRGRKTHARPCTQPLLETEFELLLREFAPAPSGALKRTRMVLDEFIARDARVACPIAFAASIRSVSAAGGGLSNFRCLFLRARGRPNAGP